MTKSCIALFAVVIMAQGSLAQEQPKEIPLDCVAGFNAIGPDGPIQTANWEDYSEEGLVRLAVHQHVAGIVSNLIGWKVKTTAEQEQEKKLGYKQAVLFLSSEEPFDWTSEAAMKWSLSNEAAGEHLELMAITPMLVEDYPKQPRLYPMAVSRNQNRMQANEFTMPLARPKMRFWAVALMKARPTDSKGWEPHQLTEDLWPLYDQDILNQFKLIESQGAAP